MIMPPKNAKDALILLRLKKKRNVLSRPMTHARPHINSIWNKGIRDNEHWAEKVTDVTIICDVCFFVCVEYIRSLWPKDPCRIAIARPGTQMQCRIQLDPHRFLWTKHRKRLFEFCALCILCKPNQCMSEKIRLLAILHTLCISYFEHDLSAKCFRIKLFYYHSGSV